MKQVIFVGGGHSHLKALDTLSKKRTLRQSASQFQFTLVNDSATSLYSGMVPGIIAGLYQDKEATISYEAFCRQRNISFKIGSFESITNESIRLSTGEELRYDLCSINIGGKSFEIPAERGSRVAAIKPLHQFIKELRQAEALSNDALDMAVIGGGAAAVEIAAALQVRLSESRATKRGQVHLFYAEETLMSRYPALGLRVEGDLRSLGVILHSFSKVKAVRGSSIVLETEEVHGDYSFIANCTGARSPFIETAIERTLLSLDGYLPVDESLRVRGLANVFAAGDCARFDPALDKSGVHAVRQGNVLAANIEKLLISPSAAPLEKYRPPAKQLYILFNGINRARIVWDGLTFSGASALSLKQWIDRRFMKKFFQ